MRRIRLDWIGLEEEVPILSLPGEGRLLATRVKTVNTELTGKTVGDGNHRYRLRWVPWYKGTGLLNSLTGITQRRG